MRIELIPEQPRSYHVSSDNLLDFEQVLSSDPRVRRLAPANPWVANTIYSLWRVRAMLGSGSRSLTRPISLTKLPGREPHDLLAVMIGLNIRKSVPFLLWPGRKSIYLCDAWPGIHEQIKEFIAGWKIDVAFVSSSQAAERLRKIVAGCRIVWVPEGICPESYRSCPYEERDVDVLQFGRRYDGYHDKIVAPLKEAGRVYLYEKVKGELVFSDRAEFTAGLARSKVSICFPSSITHPQRSGDIETMTGRYLQSMASKCLVVGHAPAEMTELFGYNPVVEVDPVDPAGQILSILDHYTEHVLLIEKNYREVIAHHTWQQRWSMIAHDLFAT